MWLIYVNVQIRFLKFLSVDSTRGGVRRRPNRALPWRYVCICNILVGNVDKAARLYIQGLRIQHLYYDIYVCVQYPRAVLYPPPRTRTPPP